SKPGIDRPEHGPALVSALAQPLDVVEQPLDLRTREVGIEDEAGACAHETFPTAGTQLLAAIGGAPVLPHDRPVQRLAGGGVPHAHRLALVGYPDGHELALANFGVVQRLAGHGMCHLPYLVGIVLHPARLREVLREFPVGPADRLGLLVEHDAGRAGCALVYCQDHRGASLSPGDVNAHEVDELAPAMEKAAQRLAGGTV